MQSLDRKLIEQLKDDNTDALVQLDMCGLLPGPGEELASFKKRLIELHNRLMEFHKELNDQGKVDLFPGFPLKKKQLITKDIINEASDVTENLYEFFSCVGAGIFSF